MKKPAYPINEKSRLKNLHSLSILDTPAEERFDRLTRLAKTIFNVPIALVSLIDANRQWFKSCFGLDVRETPRDISFCGHAILGNDCFVIPDATLDERFADNPLVTGEPNIRFYAGCPLQYLDGSQLGTLCIIDTKPRNLNEEELIALNDLAELAEHELVAIQLATLDDLTSISNRRGFYNLAQNSLDLCARQNLPASLIFFDLNNFKSINDNFGHAVGDIALHAFATIMKDTFRNSDVLARFGGDEFVVLLTDATEDFSKKILERFTSSIETYNQKEARDYNICFSYGIVYTESKDDYSIQKLLIRADKLMYKNKQNKKNK